jgi:polar amino acid transport system permease protein
LAVLTTTPDQVRPPGLWPSGKRPKRAREEGARSALIAAVSTVVLVGLALWWILSSETWPAVQRQFFNPERFAEAWPRVLGDVELGLKGSFPFIDLRATGFWLNVYMFLIAEVLILFFALVLAMIRALRGPAFFPLRALVVVFIDLIRGVPIILLILVLGFGIPALRLQGVPSSPLFWGVTTLIISYSAYTAEVYRAGIESVHESQRMAARSLGLTQVQSLRYVLVPQAIRNVIPALLNGFVSLQKDVALVFILGVREGVREAQIYTSSTFNYTSYVAATVLFLLVSVPVARFTDWYTERDRRRRQAVGSG